MRGPGWLFKAMVPKDVREAVGLRAGETVIVESVEQNELKVEHFRVIKDSFAC
jgi:AbrB family looped-hinge helix DNA binding protein